MPAVFIRRVQVHDRLLRRSSDLPIRGSDDGGNHRSALRHRGALLAAGGASGILAHIEAAKPLLLSQT